MISAFVLIEAIGKGDEYYWPTIFQAKARIILILLIFQIEIIYWRAYSSPFMPLQDVIQY